MNLSTAAAIVAGCTTLLTLGGLGYFLVALLAARSFLRRPRIAAGAFTPPVSILKPLHNLEPDLVEAFFSHLHQEYPAQYGLVFGVSDLNNPVMSAVHAAFVADRVCDVRTVLCPEALGPNGKVSNLATMAASVPHEYLVINDADIRVGPHYLARVLAPFAPRDGQPPVGLVTALYRGRAQGTLPSKLEALGIATDFAPGVLTARFLEHGLHFGLGSTLAVSRSALNAIGGLAPLADYLADDYELGARIAAAGFLVELADEVVETSVPAWTFSGYLHHQLRWARTMRDARPAGYAGLVFSYGLAWAILNLIASGFGLFSLALFSAALFARVAIALGVGVGILDDRQVLRDLWLLPIRDLLALGVWAWSYASDTIVWSGQRFILKKGKLTRLAPEPSEPEPARGPN